LVVVCGKIAFVPIHDKDMKKGTAASVLRQAGLKGEGEE